MSGAATLMASKQHADYSRTLFALKLHPENQGSADFDTKVIFFLRSSDDNISAAIWSLTMSRHALERKIARLHDPKIFETIRVDQKTLDPEE